MPGSKKTAFSSGLNWSWKAINIPVPAWWPVELCKCSRKGEPAVISYALAAPFQLHHDDRHTRLKI
jgi:hypothetical protein